jgi:flavin-dependent dehydrogenase
MVRRRSSTTGSAGPRSRPGAEVRERATVRAVEQDPDGTPAAGRRETVHARVAVGAAGSSGISARHVGVRHCQVDLGLELELPVPVEQQALWRGRVLLDWGAIPGSYAWVFPKGDRLTVGVIAARGEAERTRDYLRRFVERLDLSGVEPAHDSGHLTRCRTEDSPLRRGRVLVAGDAAGLLEPWSREGISAALRRAGQRGRGSDVAGYERAVAESLVPSMGRSPAAGRLRPASGRLPRAAGDPARLADVHPVLPGSGELRGGPGPRPGPGGAGAAGPAPGAPAGASRRYAVSMIN